MTRPNLKKINPHEPDLELLKQAAEIIEGGRLIVAPTETRYGLLGLVDSDQALARLFVAKGRRDDLPTAVFVEDIEAIEQLAEMNTSAKQVANRFLPGPLTMVLSSRLPDQAGLVASGKIGIRVSSSPVIKELTRLVGAPISATSANLSGREQPIDIDSITEQFGNSVELYLDAGLLDNPPTTVIDCTVVPPQVLRSGAISNSELEQV